MVTLKEMRNKAGLKIESREFFVRFQNRLSFQVQYIKANNESESEGHIMSKFFSYYYGNGFKLAEYLQTLNFPKEDDEEIKRIVAFCKIRESSFILPFLCVAYKISPYFGYYLSGEEYQFFVLHNVFNEFQSNTALYLTHDIKEIYNNSYDLDILDKSCKFSGLWFDELKIGRKIKDCCKTIEPLVIQRNNFQQFSRFESNPDLEKETDLNFQIYEAISSQFPNLKKYGDDERII